MKNQDVLQSYYGELSKNDARKFREECMATFGWSETTFYVRINEGNFHGPYEKREFIRILNRYLPKDKQL